MLPVIARRLKEARIQAGVSQKTLGIIVGIDEFSASARVNHYERGRHTPDYQLLEKIAQALGVPTEYFYAKEDETAELLLAYFDLSQTQKKKMLSQMKKLVGKGRRRRAKKVSLADNTPVG